MTLAIALTLIVATAAHAGKRSDVAQKLNQGLAGTPMQGTGYLLEQAGYRYRVNPALIAAIAGTESSFGAVPCRNDRFNSFGLASCTNSWPVPRFRSWKHAYMYMGRFLTERWPGATTPYSFRGYAACSDCWGRKVAYFMQRLGFPAVVKYP